MNSKTQEAQAHLINLIKFKKPRCSSDYLATRICLNPNCQNSFQGKKKIKPNEQNKSNSIKINNNPFICSNPQCRTCFYTNDIDSAKSKTITSLGVHSKCFIGEYESLLASLQQKKKDCEPLKKSINKMFESFIDYLSDLRQKQIRNLDYYGLSQNEKKFFLSFKNGQFDQVTSQLGFSIVKQLDKQIQVDFLSTKQRLEDYWQKQEKSIKKSFQMVENILFKKTTKSVNNALIGSNFITSDKQEENLIKMLQDQQKKSVKELSLLYRASQNDFDVKKFHQKCDLIEHTVVVIQTEYGKKIGGYTPLAWDKQKHGYQKDSSGKSFIFSLSNNHKFTLLKTHEQNAIAQHSYYGPTFGGGHDIYIVDKGNINNCYAKIGTSYFHPEYKFNDQASWMKFSGAIGTHEFKVKEWEVFQVKWNWK